MSIHSYGAMAVDWEERVRFDRLRQERLARIKGLLASSSLSAAVLRHVEHPLHHGHPHRHVGGGQAQPLLPAAPGRRAVMWDFGSAARHHDLYNPWLGDGRSRAGISTLRGAMSPQSGRAESVAEKIRAELDALGLLGEPVGIDAIEQRSCSRCRRPASRSSTASSSCRSRA